MKKIFLSLTAIFVSVLAISQNVGIGTNAPAEKLDVSGNIKMTGELKPNGVAGQTGQVLTSNGNGTMQWTSSSSTANANGGWGDCSIYNIDSFRLAANGNGQPNDIFGRSVAISGDYAIVGAYYDDEGGFSENGSATILKLNTATGQWESQGKLLNPNSNNNDEFGNSVSISGDYAIVGAPGDDEGALFNCGSATIFKRNSTTGIWESQGKLLNTNPESSDGFGNAVSISGDYAVVGCIFDDEGFSDCGSAVVFKRNSTTGIWEAQSKLINQIPGVSDHFGVSVSISGDYLIIGAGSDDENGYTDCGSASIYKRNPVSGNFESPVKLTNPNNASFDYTGQSVSISGEYAIIGVPYDDGLTSDEGCALIYKRNILSGLWEYQGKLINANPDADDIFGLSVSITSDYAIVGASKDDHNGGIENGTVTIFKRYDNVWYPHQKFTNPGMPSNGIRFGYSVGLHSNNRFIVSAPFTSMGGGMVFFGKIK